MDYIYVNEMEFWGYHGAFKEENVLGQRFRVTVTLATDLTKAGQTDDLDETVNYADVYNVCKEIVEGPPVKLVETLAERLASRILDQFKDKVTGCKIHFIKPDPPIPGHYQSVAVEITRGTFA